MAMYIFSLLTNWVRKGYDSSLNSGLNQLEGEQVERPTARAGIQGHSLPLGKGQESNLYSVNLDWSHQVEEETREQCLWNPESLIPSMSQFLCNLFLDLFSQHNMLSFMHRADPDDSHNNMSYFFQQ